MMAKNNFLYCVICKNPIMYCFCICPYCGDDDKICRCNQNYVDRKTITFSKKPSNFNSLMQSKKALLENHIGESWWRLEKWQIGRSKFS